MIKPKRKQCNKELNIDAQDNKNYYCKKCLQKGVKLIKK